MNKKAGGESGEHEGRVVLFQEQTVRRVWHEGEWWFSVIDVVAVLSESSYANRYWSDLKRKLAQEADSGQPYEKIVRLKLTAPDGKQRETDCANTETLLRIIQSVPSPKAEPFKRWLAQVGYERIQEIEDPELASARARELYEAKGLEKARAANLRDHMTDLDRRQSPQPPCVARTEFIADRATGRRIAAGRQEGTEEKEVSGGLWCLQTAALR